MRLSQVSPQKVGNNLSSRFFIQFSNTRRDEQINIDNINTNFVLDTNGVIYEISPRNDNESTLTVIGGDRRFLYQKDLDEEKEIYITQPQIAAIKEIARYMSYTGGGFISIESPDQYLLNVTQAYYYNFRG